MIPFELLSEQLNSTTKSSLWICFFTIATSFYNLRNLYICSTTPHVSQIITGFHDLHKNKEIRLEMTDQRGRFNQLPHDLFCEAVVNGNLIAFDVSDGIDSDMDINKYFSYIRNNNIKHIFMRSYSEAITDMFPRDMRRLFSPLGLNYHVTYYGNPIESPKYAKGLTRKMRAALKKVVKFINGDHKALLSDNLESTCVSVNNPPKILFLTRLWKPEDNIDERGYDECVKINALRTSIIRHLMKEFPETFIGGIHDDEYARQFAPDIICDKRITRKRNYLKIMKKSDICIGSMGLHKSTGWKTAEYVVAGKAIVCEGLNYQNPGEFTEGKNYLSFSAADECVSKVRMLVENPTMIENMQRENRIYYQSYVRPDKLIMNALKHVVF